jgi:hypothetical protein
MGWENDRRLLVWSLDIHDLQQIPALNLEMKIQYSLRIEGGSCYFLDLFHFEDFSMASSEEILHLI